MMSKSISDISYGNRNFYIPPPLLTKCLKWQRYSAIIDPQSPSWEDNGRTMRVNVGMK